MKYIGACRFLSVIASLSIGVQGAMAACNNVDFDMTVAGFTRGVTVIRIEYQNAAGTIFTEGLDNKDIELGETEHWNNEDLQDMVAGAGTTFTVYFKEKLSGWGADIVAPFQFIPSIQPPTFGPDRCQRFARPASVCTDGRTYNFHLNAANSYIAPNISCY